MIHKSPRRGFIIFWLFLLIGVLFSACQVHPFNTLPDESASVSDPSPGETAALPSQGEPQTTQDQNLSTLIPSPSESNHASSGRDLAVTPTTTRAADLAVTPTQPPQTYLVQNGDTLGVVAARFDVPTRRITSPDPIAQTGFLTPGQILILPESVGVLNTYQLLLPDIEVVYGPSALDFNVDDYLAQTDGYLTEHQEYLRTTGWTSASQIITRVALENSINPRILLALLEYTCGCVLGNEEGRLEEGYVLGVEDFLRKGLYGQLWWAANKLSTGYYGWRDGSLLEIKLPNGKTYRPPPDSNAGSVALEYFFAELWDAYLLANRKDFNGADWSLALDSQRGLPDLYREMFPDVHLRGEEIGSYLPADLEQPEMILPFEPGVVWSYASGPHPAWQVEGALAALDFAPSSNEPGCVENNAWVVAVADGPVIRSAHGAVVQDLDHDGHQPIISDMDERTGWVVLYMHIAEKDRVSEGIYLKAGERIGHPSCEGGPATGTHVHIARKYNGEWIPADGPIPFIMDGWTAHAGEVPYKGTLTKGDQTLIANTSGVRSTQLSRPDEE